MSESGSDAGSEPKRHPVELYLVRLSPPCRAVWLYMLQHDIPHELIDVNFTNEDKSAPEFLTRCPHKEVPVIRDNGLVVFEGQAILRYLGMKYTNFGGFGLSLTARFTTESLISWAGGELHRISGYCYAYPQFLDKYRLPTEEANEALVEMGIKELTKHLETIENGHLSKTKYLTGDRMTVADSYVATVLLQAEWVGFKFKLWPRICDWMRRVRAQEYWSEVHTAHTQFVRDLELAMFMDD